MSTEHLVASFIPNHYELSLTPDAAALAFAGSVTISGKLTKKTARIALHSKRLKIAYATVNDQPANVTLNEKTETAALQLESAVSGDVTLKLEFSGEITDPMNGLYPCRYRHKGEEGMLLGTQFESHHAREVFPCVDEPAAKATFDLSLTVPKAHETVSNTPIKSERVEGDLKTVTFETTPIMSTYLLAFVIGEMEHLEATTKDGTLVRTWTAPGKVEQSRFALETAIKILDFYNEYFGIPYPLEKCDHLALPDFAAGAMENWGCITYRETALLVDPDHTSLAGKQHVVLVIAHELAHQWFGNLVTMEWWTDLWLNEGFASWVEFLATDKLYPEWKMWEDFVVEDFASAQRLDSLASSHPIEVVVDDPDEIRSIFDAISYSKGASVIRMLHNYLGAEAFRAGLTNYLKKHAYQNAVTADLWAALADSSGQPVAEFMQAWTSQTGFPVVTVTQVSEKLRLQQQRFLVDPTKSDSETTWPIPLGQNNLMLNKREQDFAAKELPLPLNPDSSGFYMTAYDEQLLAQLSARVEQQELDAIGRLSLLNDSFQSAKAGTIPTTSALALVDHYRAEDALIVWESLVGHIGNVRRIMDTDTIREAIKPYLAVLTATQLKRLGLEERSSDTHFDTLLRPLILSVASFAEVQHVVDWALSAYDQAKSPADIPVNLRGVVYGTVVRVRNDDVTYDQLWQLYLASDSAQEKSTLVGALTGFRDPKLIERALATIRSKDVRLQSVVSWVAQAFANRHAKEATWTWLKENWDWIVASFGDDIMMMSYFPKIAASAFASQDFLKEFGEFFDPLVTPGLARPVEQGKETISWQAAWRERDLEAAETFLTNWVDHSPNEK